MRAALQPSEEKQGSVGRGRRPGKERAAVSRLRRSSGQRQAPSDGEGGFVSRLRRSRARWAEAGALGRLSRQGPGCPGCCVHLLSDLSNVLSALPQPGEERAALSAV